MIDAELPRVVVDGQIQPRDCAIRLFVERSGCETVRAASARRAQRPRERALVDGFLRRGALSARKGGRSIAQPAGRRMLVTGGHAPACETLVTTNPWRS